MDKIFRLYLLLAFFWAAGIFAFAGPPGLSPDDKPSVDTAVETNTGYLYDLKKLIKKSRENIKEVNKKIKEQAVIKRNQKREERAREYYEKGVELTNEDKLDEARDYFEKAIRITGHPEMAGYIKESQRRLKKQESALQVQKREHYKQIKQDQSARKQDVEAAYKEAVDLYKQKKYHPAKDAFEHVDEIAADYRATASYLKIIDQNIIKADALAVKQQALEIARQQKEAGAARLREKQMWLTQIAEKEKERKEAVNKQARDVYAQAVELYKNKKFAGAKNKFEEVSWVIPDYKAVRKYLARIDKDAQEEQERARREAQKALQEQRWEQQVESKKQEALRRRELEAKARQRQKDLEEQAQFLYRGAITLFNNKAMDGALKKFNDIEKLLPGFKSTRVYMTRIKQWKFDRQRRQVEELGRRQQEAREQKRRQFAPAPKPVVKIPVAPPVGAGARHAVPPPSLEDQQKQAQDIAALAEKSAQLYRQVADVSNDKYTLQTKKKLAEVNDILNNLKENKERLLRQLREEQGRIRKEERVAGAKKSYHRGLEYFRARDYAKAKTEFLAVEDLVPDYKAARRYLSRIEKYQKQAVVEAVRVYEKNQEERLKQLQEKENTKDQRDRHNIESQQQVSLKELAQKASDINDDIIRLSRGQDYGAMKVKFAELEKTVAALTALKNAMAKQKTVVKPRPAPRHSPGPLVLHPRVMSPVKSQGPLKARREAVRKQWKNGLEAMYQEALRSYQQGDYRAAADKFKDVQALLPGYKRAGQYMNKARLKSLTVKPQATVPPHAFEDSVSKALDFFESNAH